MNAMSDLRMIYDWLCDEESKEIFINRVNFLITKDYRYMHNIINK